MKAVAIADRLRRVDLRKAESYRLIDVILMAGLTVLFVIQVMQARASLIV